MSAALQRSTAPPFEWPVSVAEMIAEKQHLEAQLREVALLADAGVMRNTFFILFKWLIVEYVSLIQGCLIVGRGAAQNPARSLGDYPMLAGLEDRGVPYGDGVAPLRLKRNAETTLAKSAFNWLRRMKHQRQWLGLGGLAVQSWSDGAVAVMQPNPFLVHVLRSTGQRAYYLTPEALIGKVGAIGEGVVAPEVARLADAASDAALERIVAGGWPVSSGLRDYVRTLSRRFLASGAHDYQAVARLWRGRAPCALWSGTGGSYWVRIARAVAREQSGTTETVGFQHGATTSVFRHADLYYVEGLFATRFVTYTEAAADLLRAKMTVWPFGLPPLTVSCHARGDSHIRHLVRDQQRRPSPVGVRTVMYVPTVFRGEKQCPETMLLDDAVYLDWQRRLIAILADGGLKVLVKPHPQGMLGSRHRRYAERCEFRYEKFEEVWEEADAFVFDYSGTTAFWHAMCTKKPVVWVDHGMHPWEPAPYDHVQTRCRLVKATFDGHNRLDVDEDALLTAVKEPPGHIDYSFVRRYLSADA
jgi:hypothetical protein